MRVISKFLTADVRITGVRLEGRRVVVEGLVKELMPMSVEMSLGDVRPFFDAIVRPLRELLFDRPPPRRVAAVDRVQA